MAKCTAIYRSAGFNGGQGLKERKVQCCRKETKEQTVCYQFIFWWLFFLLYSGGKNLIEAKGDYDMEKNEFLAAEFVSELRRLADALEKGESFEMPGTGG